MSEYVVDMSVSDARRHEFNLGELTPIVRCRDCKHLIYNKTDSMLPSATCGQKFINLEFWSTEPDGYCAWGERASDD